jgi:hypothetical protein
MKGTFKDSGEYLGRNFPEVFKDKMFSEDTTH